MNRYVAGELARACLDGALLPLRAFDEFVCRDDLRRELTADLSSPASPAAPSTGRALAGLERRELSIFVACAEPSGEDHLLRLIDALRAQIAQAGFPAPVFTGIGGARLARHGVHLLADPVQRATMGFAGVASALPFYVRLLSDCAAWMESHRPDLFLAVDSPALHAPLGRIARRIGIPSVHLAAPQMWGWASWRAKRYARAFDRVLTFLPFEPAWFARRGIACVPVGHPLLDALLAPPTGAPAGLPSGASSMGQAPVLALLPGSRASVVARNLPWMLDRVLELKPLVPGLQVTIALGDTAQGGRGEDLLAAHPAREFARVDSGDLHACLARAHAAFSVSGTVLIDLLWQRLPAVVVYRLASAREVWLAKRLLIAPYFAAPNLLAGREVLPEFAFAGIGPTQAVTQAVARALTDPSWRASCRRGLEAAAERLGTAGASARAARAALDLLAERKTGSQGPKRGRLPKKWAPKDE